MVECTKFSMVEWLFVIFKWLTTRNYNIPMYGSYHHDVMNMTCCAVCSQWEY